MCPERDVLSAFLDGEIMSPWKDSIRSHIDSCPACREKLAVYQSVKSMLKSQAMPDFSENQERVWFNLQKVMRRPRPAVRMTRYASVPVPIAAAVLLLVCAGAVGFVWNSRREVQKLSQDLAELKLIEQDKVSTDFLQSMLNSTFTEEVVITLPTANYKAVSGQPIFQKSPTYEARGPSH